MENDYRYINYYQVIFKIKRMVQIVIMDTVDNVCHYKMLCNDN